MTVIMNNPKKQVTLFQSWGNKPSSTVSSQISNEKTVPSKYNDVFDDDLLLAQAMEISLAEYENQKQVDCTSSTIFPVPSCSNVENLPGFDINAGRSWVYPINFPIREYQFNIAQKVLFHNTLVVLPTGLGKTFIAAVAMYNFYRWYPQGKIIFMAPTKPLVAQQIEACHQIMGIPAEDTSEMTGLMLPNERKRTWQTKRVFFLTPQVMINDLSRNVCMAADIKLIVVDEAHKALGNYAYCLVIREISKATSQFRVLALSATPGNDEKAVNSVLNNLLISHVELRTEDSPDIQPYTFERKLEEIIVPVGDHLQSLSNKFINVYNIYANRLSTRRVLYVGKNVLSKFMLLKAREEFRQNPPSNLPRNLFSFVETDFSVCMTLSHAYDLLMQHGMRSFYNFLKDILNGSKSNPIARSELLRNNDFNEIIADLEEKFSINELSSNNDSSYIIGHPKLEKLQEIVCEHFKRFNNENSSTRIMIFSQYRDSVHEITELLKRHHPIVKVMCFTGHASTNNRTKGLTQKEQMLVVKQFRDGDYNTLVSTCVGEEGLDIGDVDLIICYDAHKSPIRLVQRMGRTGRKRKGRIVMLITEGKEHQTYKQAHYKKKLINKVIWNGTCFKSLYAANPRMVPKGLNPVCEKIFMCAPQKPVKMKTTKSKTKEIRRSKDILQYLGKQSKKESSPFLNVDEEVEWESKFKLTDEQMPVYPTLPLLSLKEDNVKEYESISKEISFMNWLPWQNTLQARFLVSHTPQTEAYVDLIRLIGNPDFSEYVENNFKKGIMTRDMDVINENSCKKQKAKNLISDKKDKSTKKKKNSMIVKQTFEVHEDSPGKQEKLTLKLKKHYIDSSSDDELMKDPFCLEDENKGTDDDICQDVDLEDPFGINTKKCDSMEIPSASPSANQTLDDDRVEKFFIMNEQEETKKIESKSFYVRTPPQNEDLFSLSKARLSPVNLQKIINEVTIIESSSLSKNNTCVYKSVSNNLTSNDSMKENILETEGVDKSIWCIDSNFSPENDKVFADMAVDGVQNESPRKNTEIKTFVSPIFHSSVSSLGNDFDLIECLPKSEDKYFSEDCSLSQLVGMVEMNSVSFAKYCESAKNTHPEDVNNKASIYRNKYSSFNSTSENIKNNNIKSVTHDTFKIFSEEKCINETEDQQKILPDSKSQSSELSYTEELPNFDLGLDLDFNYDDNISEKKDDSVDDVIPPTPPQTNKSNDTESSKGKLIRSSERLSSFVKPISPILPFVSPAKNEFITKIDSPKICFDLGQDVNCFDDSDDFCDPLCKVKENLLAKKDQSTHYNASIESFEMSIKKNYCSTPCAIIHPIRKDTSDYLFTPESVRSTPELTHTKNNRSHKTPSPNKNKIKKIGSKFKRKKLINEFIDDEAEESDDGIDELSDNADLNSSCLDQYEESFVDDDTPVVEDDIKIYLRSIRSPSNIPHLPPHLKQIHISRSSSDMFHESEYVFDSFCVDNNDIEYEEGSDKHSEHFSPTRNISIINESCHEKRKPVKRRRIIISDSSSDDEICCTSPKLSKNSVSDKDFSNCRNNKLLESSSNNLKSSVKYNHGTAGITDSICHNTHHGSSSTSTDFQQTKHICNSHEKFRNSSLGETSTNINSEKLIVFVDSKEISGGQAIVSDLRYKYGVNTVVMSLSGCDYIVSYRLAIERKLLSDVSLPANRLQLLNRLRNMHWLFEKVCLIIEQDRIKNNETSRHTSCRSKYYDSLICLLLQLPITILYSSSQEDTALLVRDLADMEKRKGFGIAFDPSLSEREEQIYKLYQKIPGINSIVIYHLVKNFHSVSQCINSSAEQIRDKGLVSMQKAKKICRFFQQNYQDESFYSEDELI